MGENAISWTQSANAWCQVRVNLCKKDGGRAKISSVEHKLLSEIHPRWEILKVLNIWFECSVTFLKAMLSMISRDGIQQSNSTLASYIDNNIIFLATLDGHQDLSY
jgi:hypothetical protein